jgi:GDP-L-fucose synthase
MADRTAATRNARIYVAGHRGMAGGAIVRRLRAGGWRDIVTADRSALDLRDQAAVRAFLADARPDHVIVAAAKVGGIFANMSEPATFLADNLAIASNLITGAHEAGVRRLMFLGSSCIYPRDCPQPIREEALLTGPLEATNEAYAIAKIAGVKLCEAYRAQHGRAYVSVMPPNLYGPGDNYDPVSSHVLAALLRKAHEAGAAGARTLTVWGSGAPRREFLYVDDLADAVAFLLERDYDGGPINIGTGQDIPVAELARRIGETVGWRGELVFDPAKPDGTPRKVLDISRMTALGWRATTSLTDGLQQAYAAFRREFGVVRGAA